MKRDALVKHIRSRMLITALCGALTLSLLAAPVAAEEEPPDQLDPPAEGEGDYLEDPSDPPASYSTAAQPSVSVNLDGPRWPRPDVESLRVGGAYHAALKLSRRLWRDGAQTAVLVGAGRLGDTLSASALAARAHGPLLVTPRDHITDKLRAELRRLGADRVFLVGALAPRVARQVANLNIRAIRLRGDNRYETNAIVARRYHALGRHPRTAIVVSGDRFGASASVTAFAAARRFPVLLTRRSRGESRLRRLVSDLGIRHVFVVGGTGYVSKGVVDRLPDVQRIAAPTAVGTVNKLARRSWRLGLNGRPVLAAQSSPDRAFAVGALMGSRRRSPLFVTRGRELSPTASGFLTDREPGSVMIVRRRVADVAFCQVRRGGMRLWYCAERTLQRQGYHMPQVDGRTDRFSVWAVFAFEKVAGRSPNGSFGEAEWQAMLRNPRHKVRRPDLPPTHVEIDIRKQLILLVENGKVRHHIHTSTGKSSTPTVRGTFTVYEKRNYMQANHMYKAIFFYGGYAIHGYPSVPTHPASHGCARTYNGNQDFLYPKIFYGERVATY